MCHILSSSIEYFRFCNISFIHVAMWCKIEVPRDVRNSKSGNKTSFGEIGLNIRTRASPKVRQDEVSGRVSVPCWHVTSADQRDWIIQSLCSLIDMSVTYYVTEIFTAQESRSGKRFLQMLYGNPSQLGKMSNSVIMSSPVTSWCNQQWMMPMDMVIHKFHIVKRS